MTPADVQARVTELAEWVKAPGGDDIAHNKADSLWEDLLKAIADGTCTDPAECARIALTTEDLNFAKWFG